MIAITEKHNCCGCNACVQLCPKQCITMHEDEEGFLYPEADVATCINCGLCEKICPILNVKAECKPHSMIAAINQQNNERENSSSGGAFVELAKQAIANGGIVFGAAFDSEWNVVHQSTNTVEGLDVLKRSKYVQSRIGDAYLKVKALLKANKPVLFVGTPCQVAGLNSFLRQPYDNLLLVEIACHGVPSPKVWKKYLQETVGDTEITSISFREKDPFGWHKYGIRIWGADNKILWEGHHTDSPFLQGMINNITLRPSCYKCKFRGGQSGADLKLSDFWKVEQVLPELEDDKGISSIFVYSNRGQQVLDCLNLQYHTIPTEAQPMLLAESKLQTCLPKKKRKTFFKRFLKDGQVSKHIHDLTRPPLLLRLKIMAAILFGK